LIPALCASSAAAAAADPSTGQMMMALTPFEMKDSTFAFSLAESFSLNRIWDVVPGLGEGILEPGLVLGPALFILCRKNDADLQLRAFAFLATTGKCHGRKKEGDETCEHDQESFHNRGLLGEGSPCKNRAMKPCGSHSYNSYQEKKLALEKNQRAS